MESYNCPLPEEIITDILSRLPAESVSSLKHVCKTWRNLLVDPNLARIHQEFHANGGDTGACNNYKVSFLCFRRSNDTGEYTIYYREYYDDKLQNMSKKKFTLNFEFSLVSSCNGLICLSVDDYVHYVDHIRPGVNNIKHIKFIHIFQDPTYVFNPITGEELSLPKLFMGVHLTVASGFGYLPSTNEYKVVRIYYEWKDETTLGKVGKVQVYTFGGENGSSKNCGQWRDICDIDYNFEHLNGVYFNGALHWLDHSHSDRTRIMAFDLAMEEFFVVKSPPDIDNFYQLCLLGGCLAIYRNNGSYFPESRRWDVSWDIWVLKKTNQNMMSYVIKENEEYYDSSWRWSRIFSVDHAQLSNFECQPLGVTNSGEILFKYCERSALCIYNPKTETFEEISCGINWKPREKYICLFHHVNTFVSPKGMT